MINKREYEDIIRERLAILDLSIEDSITVLLRCSNDDTLLIRTVSIYNP